MDTRGQLAALPQIPSLKGTLGLSLHGGKRTRTLAVSCFFEQKVLFGCG